jgi:hypothetical protein
MKKVLLSLIFLFTLNAQFTVGGSVILSGLDAGLFDSPTLIGGYIEYEAGEYEDLPYFGHVGFSTGSTELSPWTVTYTYVEIGGTVHYTIKDDIYALGRTLFSIQSVSAEGPGIIPPDADSALSIIGGVGYKMNEISFEASYGLTGVTGLRFGVGYSF